MKKILLSKLILIKLVFKVRFCNWPLAVNVLKTITSNIEKVRGRFMRLWFYLLLVVKFLVAQQVRAADTVKAVLKSHQLIHILVINVLTDTEQNICI